MNRKEALIYFILMLHGYERVLCQKMDTWKTTVVSKGNLSDANLVSKSFPCISDTVCAIQASRLSWAKLLCYKDGICTISSYISLPNQNNPAISDPEVCMTVMNDGCIYKETYYEIGGMVVNPSVYSPLCGNPVCQQNNIMNPFPLAAQPGSCASPFSQTIYGCFYNPNLKMNFCDASQYCQSIGGSLWTFENNQTSSFINSAFPALGVPTSTFFLGLFEPGIGSGFMFVNGASAANFTSDMWYSDPLLAGELLCTYAGYVYMRYCIGRCNCTLILDVLCQKPLSP